MTETDTHTLAVSMQKGGVGKSTTSINLAGALANRLNGDDGSPNRVLLVDADPQGFSTITLGYRDQYAAPELSLYDVMTDVERFDEVNDLIIEGDEFDILPSHGKNFQLERELWSLSRTKERLGMVLEEIEKPYDYIIIDSPPNMGPLADGSLLAAGHVLFVSKPDKIATFSMRLLLEERKQLGKEFMGDANAIGIAGAVVNAVDRNQIADERLEWFRENIGEANTHVVPKTVAIEGAFADQASIFGAEQTNAHREKKAEEVQAIYDELATHVVNYYE